MTPEEESMAIQYHIAVLLGIITGIVSLGVAVLPTMGANPLLDATVGAAFAWAIGAATILWWLPWVKQAVPVEYDDRE